jgi:hypothetical protein
MGGGRLVEEMENRYNHEKNDLKKEWSGLGVCERERKLKILIKFSSERFQ